MRIYIFVRKDLGMPVGKVAVQVGHAVEAISRNMGRTFLEEDKDSYIYKEHKRRWDAYTDNSLVKVVLGVEGEKAFDELVSDLSEVSILNTIPHHMVSDIGLNFFDGVITKTAFAIGPADRLELGKYKRFRVY